MSDQQIGLKVVERERLLEARTSLLRPPD